MSGEQFTDGELAERYDEFQPPQQRADYRFHLGLMRPDDAVLDIGCGTGSLLHRARDRGHRGRLCGLDPAGGMLALARRRTDVEWIEGELGAVRFEREFDLIVMTGHAFQELATDDQLRTTLAAVRRALTDRGRFAFDTRNPAARAWEQWIPANARTLPDGTRMAHQVDRPVTGELVSFTTTFTHPDWAAPRRSHSTLRFLDAPALDRFLTEAGLAIQRRHGDFDGGPFTPASAEIVTVAGPA